MKKSKKTPPLTPATPTAPDSPSTAPPPLSQTVRMILLIWGALAVFSLLWRLWTRNGLIIFFSAAAVGLCFALVAFFDHFGRRFGDKN